MCTRTFLIEIGTFLCSLKTLKQIENVLMCSKIFKTSRTFPFNQKILEQNQNVLICSEFYKTKAELFHLI
jgi:hypothetical protein